MSIGCRWIAVGVAGIVWLASVAAGAVGEWRGTWHDEARDRQLPLRVFYPDPAASAPLASDARTGGGAVGPEATWPVILFSPGLGGSREGYAYLGRHWAEAGFVVVHLQHPGSDDAVWRDALRAGGRRAALNALQAAVRQPANFVDRPRDVSFVLDELIRRAGPAMPAVAAPGATDPAAASRPPAIDDDAWPLVGRLDFARVGVGGHSFGAYTALVVAGATLPGLDRLWPEAAHLADPRVRAAVVLSAPRLGQRDPAATFAGVHAPLWVMTGTADTSRIDLETTPALRQLAFVHAPHVARWLTVFEGGTHALFGGHERPGGGAGLSAGRGLDLTLPQPDAAPTADPARLAAIREGTTAFLRATLLDDPAAAAWLAGADGYRALLRPVDVYAARPAAR